MTLRRLIPADVRRYGRDVREVWREMPRLREARTGASSIPGPYFIKTGYRERGEPTYDDLSQVGANWQASVYSRARGLAEARGARRVVDVGCGDCRNRHLLGGLEFVGLDFGTNLEAARSSQSNASFFEVDLEDDADALPADVARSVVVCADVIEHLRRPERLLAKLRRALVDGATVVVLSTPERDLLRGRDHLGPPPNTGHVREWNRAEFAALLSAERFVGTTELAQSNDRSPERKTILAVLSGTF